MAEEKKESHPIDLGLPRELHGIDAAPSDWVQSSRRTRDIVIFCCGLGCVWTLLDRCFSSLTGQDRVFGQSRQPYTSVRTVDSVEVISGLSNEREYRHFATKNYGRFNLWHQKTPEEIELAGEKLLLQSYIDKTERHFRKDGGVEQIAWIATILGACVSIIEFIRAIVAENPDNRSALRSIGYVEGFLGLSALIITQIKNKQIQTDSKAATALDNFYNWAQEQVKALKTLAGGSQNLTHAKDRLIKMNFYRVITSENEVKPLLKAMAAARNNRGYHETEAMLQRKLEVFKRQQTTSENIQTENAFDEAGLASLQDVEDLAHALGCPIFVVSEHNLPNNSHHMVFEGTAPAAVVRREDTSGNDEKEDNGDAKQQEPEDEPGIQIVLNGGAHPENFIVLYSKAPNQYEALTIPLMSRPIQHDAPVENRPINYEETKVAMIQLDAYILARTDSEEARRSSSVVTLS